MTIAEALQNINYLAFDTAPMIYYIENHPEYADKVQIIIDFVDNNSLKIIGATLLLTEVLVNPLKLMQVGLINSYKKILLEGYGFQLYPINTTIAIKAAELRATYNLKTPDALHLATAIISGADAFLTNDKGFKRVNEITILVLDDLEI